MADNPGTNGNIGGENQRIGRELYEKDKEESQPQQRYGGYRGDNNRKWDAGNYFHTGPSSRGAQNGPGRQNNQNFENNHPTYERARNADLNTHYGSRPDSPYRNEQAIINHGDGDYNRQQGFVSNGSRPGNYTDNSNYQNEVWHESPGSRYEDDDYRYGSGSHNWYREGRYAPDNTEHQRDQRGFFQRVKDGWNDIIHSDDPAYTPNHPDSDQNRRDRAQRSPEAFRDRRYNKGYENGPRWADPTDTGNDSYYNDTDRTQRYRR